MKLYCRDAFMRLPPGTLYTKGKPWYFNGLSVKGETLPNEGKSIDWVCLGLEWIDAKSDTEAAERFELMQTIGASFPMETSYGRDGAFDDEDLFLVYEKDDLLRLREIVSEAIGVLDTPASAGPMTINGVIVRRPDGSPVYAGDVGVGEFIEVDPKCLER